MYTPKRSAHFFSNFDVFNKQERQVLVRSRYGGVLTISALIVMLCLVVFEITEYRDVELIQSVTVDTSRDDSLTLHLDIVFHDMVCEDVHFDVVDQMGKQTNVGSSLQTIKVENIPGTKDNCPPCVIGSPARCCTCQEVRQYYHQNSIQGDAEFSSLCMRQLNTDTLPSTSACRVTGVLPIPKIQGNFHVAPGAATTPGSGSHSHQMNPFTFRQDLAKMKLSHTINALTFGPNYPGKVDPLTNYYFNTNNLVKQTYNLKLVPTLYIEGGIVIQSHQYSVTNHTDVIDLSNMATLQLPGIFFKYDFSPMLVKLERKPKYFTHFLTRLCAIIGGTWVVLGLIYSTLQSAVDKLKKSQ